MKPIKLTPRPTPKVQPPGGKVQPEKHETIKTDRGTFKFREPVASDWK